ncbi:MAG: glycosyl hydrolase [Bacteroidales bacterium]
MKKFYPVFLGLILLISCGKSHDPAAPVNDFSQLKAFFAEPPSAYRTQPFWVWNDSITREMIDEQLADYKKMGFGGVFIHPRYGLITEYLGKDWHELYKYASDKAASLGLEVWIYDENSFPSGFAGGLVPAEMPESYNQGQSVILRRQEKLQLDSAKKYFRVYLVKNGKFADITADTAKFSGKKGDFTLLELGFFGRSKWYAGYSYVDLLKPGVTEKFIEITMSGYERNLSPLFKQTVKGVFTDEPNTNPQDDNAIRWTPDLFEQFEKTWGYSLDSQLISLFEETGNWRKVRHDYYSTILQLFIDRWSLPWKRYADSTGLIWTGHYWEHGWPGLADGPDNMAMYEYHQMPGIDMLFNTMEQSAYPEQFGNIRAVKELASAANQTGKRRTLSETYGAAGWELTFADMKRLGDWEYVLGVNFMNQHLSYMSLKGDRKHDFPQSFSYHEPWWKEYKMMVDYFGRLSLALSSGRQVNRILVLEPTTTAWMYNSPLMRHPAVDGLRTSFHDFLKSLEKNQVEYDLGCENIIRNRGSIDSGRFVVGERAYDLVVLPPNMENFSKSTIDLLHEYLGAGGKVIAVNARPGYIDGNADTSASNMPVRFLKDWISVPVFPEEGILQLMHTDGLTFDDPSHAGGQLLHARRMLEDGQLIFLVNSSPADASMGSFHAEGTRIMKLDLFTGTILPYECTVQDGQVKASFDLAPGNSMLLFIAKEGKNKKSPSVQREFVNVPADGHSQVHPLTENVLMIDYCRLSMEGMPDTTTFFYNAGFMVWSKYGNGENPWVSSSQFRTELVDRDTFSTGTGFSLNYSFLISEGMTYEGMKAVAEQPRIFKFLINGEPLPPEPGKWWLDRVFRSMTSADMFIRAKIPSPSRSPL